jgi:hypothetical protein
VVLINIDFQYTPTVYDAVTSQAFVHGIRGPVGSGKSVGGVGFIMSRAAAQLPSADGIRRTRFAVVRNTAPELKTTTIKTVEEWIPPGAHGRVINSSPVTYRIRSDSEDGTGIDCEILFIALDRPADVRKLLSLELTSAWANEAREIPFPVIDGLTMRVGRYPSMKNEGVPATYAELYLDTNSMDQDHWWYERFESGDTQTRVMLDDGSWLNISWEGFSQPPAVLEVQDVGSGVWASNHPMYKAQFREEQVIFAAGKFWGVNPNAENIQNLRPGYYHQQLKNKSLEHIQCYYQNLYVYVKEGRPVTPEYVPSVHGAIFPIIDSELIMGVDAGGGTLNPAATFIQKHPMGNWLVQSEFIGRDIGVDNFARALRLHKEDVFGDMPVSVVWMDPAAEKRDEIYETRVMQYFQAEGFVVRGAPTQDVQTRIDAIRTPLGRMLDGKPGLMVHKERCPTLHKGLSGAWFFKQLQISGAARYHEKPDKSHPYSDICESLGYGLCGGGEYHAPLAKRQLARKQMNMGSIHKAITNFNPYDA